MSPAPQPVQDQAAAPIQSLCGSRRGPAHSARDRPRSLPPTTRLRTHRSARLSATYEITSVSIRKLTGRDRGPYRANGQDRSHRAARWRAVPSIHPAVSRCGPLTQDGAGLGFPLGIAKGAGHIPHQRLILLAHPNFDARHAATGDASLAAMLPSFSGIDSESHPTLKGNPNSIHSRTEPI